MKRQVTMEEISDGKLYTSNDLVKQTVAIVRDATPVVRGWEARLCWIRWILSGFAGEQEAAFETLLAGKIELNVVDGIILPNLKMAGAEDGCGFLTEEGRCGIHPFRPGICRLFPLGRYYEEKGFPLFPSGT